MTRFDYKEMAPIAEVPSGHDGHREPRWRQPCCARNLTSVAAVADNWPWSSRTMQSWRCAHSSDKGRTTTSSDCRYSSGHLLHDRDAQARVGHAA